jgi:tRNA G18 (ribose-2'-O)-methylase SpoU
MRSPRTRSSFNIPPVASRKTEIKRFMRKQPRPSVRLCFLLADVEDPVNVGSAFRIADACGIEEMVLAGITARPPHKLIGKVGRGKDQRVKWRHAEDAVEAIASLKSDGWRVVALEITGEAEPYFAAEWAPKTCLVVGHEDHGVTKKVLAACDGTVFLPMYGKGASLNVHVALGVLAFHVLHREQM